MRRGEALFISHHSSTRYISDLESINCLFLPARLISRISLTQYVVGGEGEGGISEAEFRQGIAERQSAVLSLLFIAT